LESTQSLDVEALVDRARSLWHDASDRASMARVELFAKAAVRCRVARGLDGTGARSDCVRESGLAIRTFRAGDDHAGFAAASGLSTEVARWVVDAAYAYRAQTPALAPSPSDSVAEERWDLDDAIPLPSEEILTAGLIARPHLEWVEAGTTVEVLIGAEGWLAVRRRHRLWALGGAPEARLVAQRGIANWEQLLDESGAHDRFGSYPVTADFHVLVLTPSAAAPVVAALVESFHGKDSAEWVKSGDGWDVVDEPARLDGLSGGSFDDAGFPAVSRVLAADGFWVGQIGGPGTYRRGSFRQPPEESPSNLVMVARESEALPARAVIARRCRVLRASSDLWVLELDLANVGNGCDLDRRWVRVQPRALMAACSSRLGRSRVTPSGPIVPALRFDGLTLG